MTNPDPLCIDLTKSDDDQDDVASFDVPPKELPIKMEPIISTNTTTDTPPMSVSSDASGVRGGEYDLFIDLPDELLKEMSFLDSVNPNEIYN